MNTIIRTTGVLLLISALGVGITAPAAYAVDWVRADITCAPSVNVKFDWQNHFGSDPRFSVNGTSLHEMKPVFQRMYREGQIITCIYLTPRGEIFGSYGYMVKRQIHPVDGCKQLNPRTLSCLVRDK